MKYNYNKLRGKIKEHFGTQEKFANALGISDTSLTKKLNNIVFFNQNEMKNAKELLNLENIDEYFFTF